MIAATHRFHGHTALRYVYKQGRTARTSQCLLRYAPNPRNSQCRLAVVVSKKVSKSAVVRNRLRRRIYGALGGRIGELPAYDLVFTVLDERLARESGKNINNIIIKLLQISAVTSKAVDQAVDK